MAGLRSPVAGVLEFSVPAQAVRAAEATRAAASLLPRRPFLSAVSRPPEAGSRTIAGASSAAAIARLGGRL